MKAINLSAVIFIYLYTHFIYYTEAYLEELVLVSDDVVPVVIPLSSVACGDWVELRYLKSPAGNVSLVVQGELL